MLRPIGSYEALAAMHQQSREDRENDEAAGILPAGGRSGRDGGGGGGGGMGASAAAVARTRRLRDKNEPCVLPDRLLHRVSTNKASTGIETPPSYLGTQAMSEESTIYANTATENPF